MELSKRRIYSKHLEPARPLRRLNIDPEPRRNGEIERMPYPCIKETPMNGIGVDQFYEIIHLHTQRKPKKERICYSREFLIKLASSPIAKRKPNFLPEHPVVLEKPMGMHAKEIERMMYQCCFCNGTFKYKTTWLTLMEEFKLPQWSGEE